MSTSAGKFGKSLSSYRNRLLIIDFKKNVSLSQVNRKWILVEFSSCNLLLIAEIYKIVLHEKAIYMIERRRLYSDV
jgi:hypothetical protein